MPEDLSENLQEGISDSAIGTSTINSDIQSSRRVSEGLILPGTRSKNGDPFQAVNAARTSKSQAIGLRDR